MSGGDAQAGKRADKRLAVDVKDRSRCIYSVAARDSEPFSTRHRCGLLHLWMIVIAAPRRPPARAAAERGRSHTATGSEASFLSSPPSPLARPGPCHRLQLLAFASLPCAAPGLVHLRARLLPWTTVVCCPVHAILGPSAPHRAPPRVSWRSSGTVHASLPWPIGRSAMWGTV